jgi:predicted PurR-regulated permease PerM
LSPNRSLSAHANAASGDIEDAFPGVGAKDMPSTDHDPSRRDQLTAIWVDLTIRLGVLGLLLYLSVTLIRPFITIAIWSVVLTVALYPMYDWMVDGLGGRRRLAAILLTIVSLLIVIGPATWLTLGLIDSLGTGAARK